MVNLLGLVKRMTTRNILVVGDIILDTYTIGKARRISPEAPVPVVNVVDVSHKPGGAGNVALNMNAMGLTTRLLGRVGNDQDGALLRQVLMKEGVHVEGIITQSHYHTPVKNRIIAENQQIVRFDREEVTSIPEVVEDQVIEMLPAMLEGIDIVAISDYGKGFLSKTLLSALIELSNERQIPVIVDPKGTDFVKYRGADLIKPNLGEAYAAANLSSDAPLENVANTILDTVKSRALMITRASEGISVFYADGVREDFPAKVREVKDVTGAGDTVLAMVTCAMANQLSYAEAAQLSNIAAGISLEKLGCATITLSDLSMRLLDIDSHVKILTEETLFVLRQDCKYTLLKISLAEGLTTEIYQTIKRLNQSHPCYLVVQVIDEEPSNLFIQVLASIKEIDYVIVEKEIAQKLLQIAEPYEIYSMKNIGSSEDDQRKVSMAETAES